MYKLTANVLHLSKETDNMNETLDRIVNSKQTNTENPAHMFLALHRSHDDSWQFIILLQILLDDVESQLFKGPDMIWTLFGPHIFEFSDFYFLITVNVKWDSNFLHFCHF